jgi:hypothetical protein
MMLYADIDVMPAKKTRKVNNSKKQSKNSVEFDLAKCQNKYKQAVDLCTDRMYT